jgi:Dolichyl-phosphate-mannose-protein mannosyltransferase
MIVLCLAALGVGYLPGALLFRLPAGQRARRARLEAGERVFWHIVLSVAWSLAVVLVLAAFGAYTFGRLLLVNGVLCGVLCLAVRGGLRYGGHAARPGWTVVVPVALVALGAWRFFPPSEYIMGGKDPGVYVNEGIQIAQRGSLIIHDPTVAAVPRATRSLFFPYSGNADYYSVRFMGFFVQNPDAGTVVGQFPHLFPASIAIGYGLNGLSGARQAAGIWAMLGLLAVYFAGARLVGRVAAAGAAILLGLNVADVWFSRYPNSDIVMQALLFTALLAFARANDEADGFFGLTAGALVGLLLFLRFDAVLVVAGLGAGALLLWLVERRRPRAGFVLTVAAAFAVVVPYLTGPLREYFHGLPAVWLSNLPATGVAAAAIGGLAALGILLWLRRRNPGALRTAVPLGVMAIIVAAAGYALFLRHPGGRLADYDAYALDTFSRFYLRPLGLVLALAGFVLVVRREFWRAPAFVLTFAGFSLFFFYKTHVVPVQFWMARHYLPIILPGALLFAVAAAVGATPSGLRGWRAIRPVAGLVLVGLLGWQYQMAAAPVLPHVEYAGLIPAVERLASRFTDRDLVIVESRDTNADTHVLAVPLAYIYGRNVLVLAPARPDKVRLEAFLADALRRYARVFFIGGGGSDLLSRHILATPVQDDRLKVPEFEVTPWSTFPSRVDRKDFDFSVYQLSLGTMNDTDGFTLDVGYEDDLNVLRFYAKEVTEGRTIRWTGPTSYVAIPGLTGHEHEVVLTMHDGGRPTQAPPARVRVFFDDVPLGTIDVGPGFRPYRLALPAHLAAAAAARDEPAQLKLVSTVWNPHKLLGSSDDRDLGVMVDRVEVH